MGLRSAFTTRKAKAPGRKLQAIAASGVFPLFVDPIVLRTLSKGQPWAMANSVRLDTYNAEFLRSGQLKSRREESLNIRSSKGREQERSIQESWKRIDTRILDSDDEW